jgi:hypothetical protein
MAGRWEQQNTFRQADWNSGKVWIARWDSWRSQNPVIPPVSGNWCQIQSPRGFRFILAMML